MSRVPLLLVLSAACALGAEKWTRVTTTNFELYTTTGEKRGRETVLYFEEVRSFFAHILPPNKMSDPPVRNAVFSSEQQYRPYAITELSFAYYMGNQYRDYIVMQDAEAEHFPSAIHENTHLVVGHQGLRLPPWLNEGLADLYSSLKPVRKQTVVGELIPRRIYSPQSEKWMSFDALTSVRQDAYNDRSRIGIFYAESWALVHMLYLAPEYRAKFGAFVSAINDGSSAAGTFEFGCGPQKPFHVVVEFAPPAKNRSDVRGSLRSLEF